jgi:hypothetical protein
VFQAGQVGGEQVAGDDVGGDREVEAADQDGEGLPGGGDAEEGRRLRW